MITASVAMLGKQSVDHVGFEMFPIHDPWLQQNPLEVIQLRPLPTSKPTASGNRSSAGARYLAEANLPLLTSK